MITPNPIAEDNPSGALIGIANLLTSVTVTGDTSSTEDNCLTPNTYGRWRPIAATVVATFSMAALDDVDYIGIAGHNLSGETILLQTSTDDVTYTDVESITPTDNSAIMITFDARNIRYVKLTMVLAAANEIAVVFAGKALQMPRSIYGGHSPLALSQESTYHSSISESGQFLGSTEIRKGTKGSFAWQFLDDEWYRETFQPFVIKARTLPYFIKWRPDYYDEVAYVRTTANVKPSNMGSGHRLMSVSINVAGHEDV